MSRKPQKALHLYLDEDKAKPAHIGQTYAVMEKFDGWYMYIDCINGQWQEIRSRACRELDSMRHYTKMVKENFLAPKADCRLIFEACLYETNGLPMVFSKLNGLFNQKKVAIKEGAVVESKTLGRVEITRRPNFKLHDLVIFGREDKVFNERYLQLKYFMRAISKPKPEVLLEWHVVPMLDSSSNPDTWYAHYEAVCKKYSNNGEGVILKKVDAPYTYNKKCADILKIKCEESYELKVVALEEGEGKYKGTLGKLKVQDANGVINFVSGMSDIDRELWWSQPELIMHKIVEVKCMKVLKNKSLREGRYKAIRHDKTEVDAL